MLEQLTPRQVADEYPALPERRQKDLRAAKAIAYHRLGYRTIIYLRRDIDAFLSRRRIEAVARGGRK